MCFFLQAINIFYIQFCDGSVSKKNPLALIKNQIPGYTTALGTQDSFGTACNISGDNAIGIVVDTIYKKFILKETTPEA